MKKEEVEGRWSMWPGGTASSKGFHRWGIGQCSILWAQSRHAIYKYYDWVVCSLHGVMGLEIYHNTTTVKIFPEIFASMYICIQFKGALIKTIAWMCCSENVSEQNVLEIYLYFSLSSSFLQKCCYSGLSTVSFRTGHLMRLHREQPPSCPVCCSSSTKAWLW